MAKIEIVVPSLPWAVYRNGEQVGMVRYAEDAACLVSMSGGQVRYGRKVVWFEEDEQFSAGESYDRAAEVMMQRAGCANGR